ncbi:outer membrane lipoprotein carrier protein [Geobacter argillaceus]|uniref:Outer membrane lipoprotein carrier protein n=2 Tax=Geobacter argillaceus TaxID=345631 RepID=A0A562WT13_9BACT|nr:outer membrane lipoprotein carrier protein [Geobacter argillaceus]
MQSEAGEFRDFIMFKLFSRILTAALVAALAVPAAATPVATLREVVATLERGYGALHDLQAGFSQRTTISAIKREEKGSGELLLKKGKGANPLFRFNYANPKQQIICDGKTVWFYQQENRQVLVSDAATLFAGGNAIAMSYLTGLGRLSQDFTIRFAGQAPDLKGNYTLELLPRKPTPAVAKLQLTVAGDAVEQFRASGKPQVLFPIISSVLYDPMGNRTVIEYSSVKVNRGMVSERFNFKVPQGVQVIENR